MSVLQRTEIAFRKGLNSVYSGAPLPRCVFPRYHDEFDPPSSKSTAHDWSSSPGAAGLTFFDILPFDVLENMLRQSSVCPRKKDWHKYLNPEDVNGMFSGQSPLQFVAKKLLHRLLIGDDVRTVGRGCVMVPRDSEVTMVQQTVDSMAKFLQQVYVRQLPTNADFLLTVANKCRSLTRLAVKEAPPEHLLRYLFESRGHQLTQLSLNQVPASILGLISARCRVLRSVNIERPSGSLDALWKSVGNTLENVQLYFETKLYETSCLKSIQLHCCKLRIVHIELTKRSFSYPAYAGLLALCGGKLSKAFLGSMDSYFCKRLAAACPRARFTVNGHRELSLQMAALGSSLDELRCRSALDPVHMAADRCCNLRAIFISFRMSCTVQIMRALFSKPKLHLETLGIGCTTGVSQEIIGIVVKGTGSLKKFLCVADGDEQLSFLSLAKANPGLRSVRLQFVKEGYRGIAPFPYEKAERIIVNMLMCLKLCAHVQEMVAWALPAPGKLQWMWRHDWGESSSTIDKAPILVSVADACCVFRGQRTYVRVFGRDYLP